MSTNPNPVPSPNPNPDPTPNPAPTPAPAAAPATAPGLFGIPGLSVTPAQVQAFEAIFAALFSGQQSGPTLPTAQYVAAKATLATVKANLQTALAADVADFKAKLAVVQSQFYPSQEAINAMVAASSLFQTVEYKLLGQELPNYSNAVEKWWADENGGLTEPLPVMPADLLAYAAKAVLGS